MPLYDLLAYGKAHAASFILTAPAVKPLERGKNGVQMLFLKPDAVILDDNSKVAGVIAAPMNFHEGSWDLGDVVD
jgi:hypothetical protein